MKILFVCRGNICRSPTAEGAMKAVLQRSGIASDYFVDSAALMDWHVGKGPDSRSIKAADKQGVNISTQKARQLEVRDFDEFDAIYVMDDLNVQYIKDNFADYFDRVELLAAVLEEPEIVEVPDPYDGTEADFDATFLLISRCCEALVGRIISSTDP